MKRAIQFWFVFKSIKKNVIYLICFVLIFKTVCCVIYVSRRYTLSKCVQVQVRVNTFCIFNLPTNQAFGIAHLRNYLASICPIPIVCTGESSIYQNERIISHTHTDKYTQWYAFWMRCFSYFNSQGIPKCFQVSVTGYEISFFPVFLRGKS